MRLRIQPHLPIEAPVCAARGFVILKHTTEIDAEGNTPTTLTFYSVYAHMKELAPGIAKFGSIYVCLPAGTPVQTAKPTCHIRATTAVQTLGTAQWVQISYANNTTPGSATLTSFKTDGSVIGTPRADPDAEYDLYKEANTRHNSLNDTDKTASSPSGWYELLRFGRNLGRSVTDSYGTFVSSS